jgi:glycosyltransferase involved in cell wall biosynthesis
MTMAPTVSIVLPSHDGAAFLRQALESCLDQTLTDWELVAIDDGSIDETPTIFTEYARRDSRVRIVTHRTAAGLPAALNAGFAAARGRYFTWISDDNRYRPHALARLVAELDADSTIDVVYSDYSVIDEDGREIELRRALPAERLAIVNCVGASFLYRRAVHETLGGFDAAKMLVEDYDFWLRAAARFRLAPLGENLYLYRIHAGSLSARQDLSIVAAHRRLLREQLPSIAWLDAAARARACVHLARTTLGRSGVVPALWDLSLALRIDPAAAAADCAARMRHALTRRFVHAA